MRVLKLTLAYDGTDFAGWQVQPDQRTVQQTLEETFAKITGEKIRAIASGRTDAGVHAAGQVVSLKTHSQLSAEVIQRALNAELPDDVAVLSAAEAPPDFHAIRDAVRKRYRYFIHDGPVREVLQRRYVWIWPSRLDAESMHRAAGGLLGEHDFSSFESVGAQRASSVRTITDISVRRGQGGGNVVLPGQGRAGDLIAIDVEADGFLYNMVRAIVGTLVEVGRGARSESWPANMMEARDRSRAGPTAPPQGLFLVEVKYGE